jgi:hypothetical protein
LAFEVTQQGYIFYNSLSDKISKGALFGYGCTSADSKVCSLLNQAESFSKDRLSAYGFDKQLQKLIPILQEKITSFILSIPIIIAEIFLTIVLAYFVLKDWEEIFKKITDMLPMRKKTVKRLIKEFGDITYTVVYAQLFVALIQGIIGTIGFYLFGVPFPMILGILLAFCTLIPTAGTALIWLPASLFLILSGYFSHDYGTLFRGIGACKSEGKPDNCDNRRHWRCSLVRDCRNIYRTDIIAFAHNIFPDIQRKICMNYGIKKSDS